MTLGVAATRPPLYPLQSLARSLLLGEDFTAEYFTLFFLRFRLYFFPLSLSHVANFLMILSILQRLKSVHLHQFSSIPPPRGSHKCFFCSLALEYGCRLCLALNRPYINFHKLFRYEDCLKD